MRQDLSSIVFGWDRATDERSLCAFLERFCRPELLATLVPRLSGEEITAVVDQLTGLMGAHLSEEEYHRLFTGK